MALAPGSHRLGPDTGRLVVRVFREGPAQKMGHDLVLAVEDWTAMVEVDESGRPVFVRLEADPDSLEVVGSANGIKALTDRDREEILGNVARKVLRGRPIAFASDSIQGQGRLSVTGSLQLGGSRRELAFEATVASDGSVHAVLPVVQSRWGIKPYSALMGALRVRDSVEVDLTGRLPVDSASAT